MIFRKFIKAIFTIGLLLFIAIFLYLSTAFILSFFPKKNSVSLKKDKHVYILYNNAHSDILFNIEELSEEWIDNLIPLKNKKRGYIAFGWGDKETYLNTPDWNQLKLSTALKALFIKTPSLMHVSYYSSIRYFKDLKDVPIDKHQSKAIKNSILKSFNFKEKAYKGYFNNDFFYASPYTYNLVHTCNTWTGDTLRDANVTMSYWTPLSQNVIYSLP